MQKLWSYPHFTGSGNGSGSGTGDRAWYWFRYRYRISLVVPVPVRNSVPVGSLVKSIESNAFSEIH